MTEMKNQDLRGQIASMEDVRRYVYAGNAVFTLANTTTGARYTFRIQAPINRETGERELTKGVYWLSLLNGPDNTQSFVYVGKVIPSDVRPLLPGTAVQLGLNSKVTAEAPSFKAADWFIRLIASSREMPEGLEIWHEGSCGRCGRRLTVPESIEAGLGPICRAKAMGVAA